MKEAMLYKKTANGRAQCYLCAHRCLIAPGGYGVCQVRENQEGTLYTMVYGSLIAQHVDPIEKKPLFHFRPGSNAFSIAAPGCNFRCRWCQNWDISQMPRERGVDSRVGQEVSPERVVTTAQRTGCQSIAYTYTEPTIFFEYTYDTARLAREAGLDNVYVTNGYMTEEMLETIHPWLDAANVDLKAFRGETYRRYVGARLQPVLDSLKAMKRLGIWVEVTTLIVPGVNDDPAEIRDAARFVAEELGVDTPWHLSRFFPSYQMMDVPPTALSTMREAGQIGRDVGLRYVYLGNVPGESNTLCHQCGNILIRRLGFQVLENRVAGQDRCPDCGAQVAGVGMGTTRGA